MHSAKIAEWILARWTTREHAAAIVGDLMEAAAGPFWWSIARTVAGLAWPMLAGLAAAMAAVALGVWPLMRSTQALQSPGPALLFFRGMGPALAAVAGYAAVRYGLADRMTQLAGALAAAGVCGVLWRDVPVVTPVCAAVGVGAVVLASLSAEGRRAAVALGAAVAGSILAWKILWMSLPAWNELPRWARNLENLARFGAMTWAPVWAAVWVRRTWRGRSRRLRVT
jgi:hypothetical protein